MKWSWSIGRIRGIDVRIHATLLILLLWVGLARTWLGALMVAGVFLVVLLHELGHAFMALRYGVATREITLLPIGGLARLERIPEEPRQEIAIALAGPAVNLILAAVAYGAMLLNLPVEWRNVLATAAVFNLTLAAFNLLPAFPMDGGRVLRAVMASRVGYLVATRRAAEVGQAMAMFFGLMGLVSNNPMLVFIGFFVWLGAGAEATAAEIRAALRGATVRDAMLTHFECLHPGNALAQAVEHLLAGFQHDFPVLDDGRLIGILYRDALLKALGQSGMEATVATTMGRDFRTSTPDMPLEMAVELLGDSPILPVIEEGRLVGLINRDNLWEFVVLQGARPVAA